MEKVVKEIANYLNIPQKKHKAELNREEITKCNVWMSDMTASDINVARYARAIEQIQYLLKDNDPADVWELKRLREEITRLQQNKSVREYQAVIDYRQELIDQISEYYRTIQVDFRRELLDVTLPEIYVSQGQTMTTPRMQITKHIITPGTMILDYAENIDTLILPESQILTSARSCRHFYNQVSFKYLEQLTDDYSFDLEEKDLGNVRVLRRGK